MYCYSEKTNQKLLLLITLNVFFYFESVLDCIYKEDPVLFRLNSLDI